MTRCDGNDLRKARKEAGLTQLEASERLGVSEGTLKRWENCEKGQKPSSGDVSRMEEIYDAPGLWYLWMLWNDDGFRDHMPELPDIPPGVLAPVIGIRHEMADVQQLQNAVERDRLDGRIDDQRAHAIYGKETDDLLAALLAMKMFDRR